MPNIGVWEIVIVVVIALLIFGPKKLPELGSSLGRSITGFKKGLKETGEEVKAAMKEDVTAEAKIDAVAASTATADTAGAAARATPATEASTEALTKTDTV